MSKEWSPADGQMLPVLSMHRLGPASAGRFALTPLSWDFKGMLLNVTQDMQLGTTYGLCCGVCSSQAELWLVQSLRAACLLPHGRCSPGMKWQCQTVLCIQGVGNINFTFLS